LGQKARPTSSFKQMFDKLSLSSNNQGSASLQRVDLMIDKVFISFTHPHVTHHRWFTALWLSAPDKTCKQGT
jgi:hypothetical protein